MEIYFTSWRVSSWVVFSTSYGENKLFDQFYHISAFDFISQEFPAYLHGLWKVDLVWKFSASFWFWTFDLCTVCCQLWKIVHHHSGVYFLLNTVRLFWNDNNSDLSYISNLWTMFLYPNAYRKSFWSQMQKILPETDLS